MQSDLPLVGAHGSRQLATVYVEIEPGDSLGAHTDSAEELLVILQGQLNVSIGGEETIVSAGDITLVPKMVTHNLCNVGPGKAKVLGVFGGSNHIVATFEKEWLPANSNVVDTALLFKEYSS
ncbi:cupin domain-containing protein [Anseongella ginsenosidimutans]|nr:cupin domain-containing protein [Anseongella ginsenosidimutans]